MWSNKFLFISLLLTTLRMSEALPPTQLGIAGGRAVTSAEAKYVAWVNGCTGSLISNNYVLTAAHCAYKKTRFGIYLGVQKNADFLTAKGYSASEVKVHPNFTDNSFHYDIALLKLSESVHENDKIKIVKLPSKTEQNDEYTKLTAYGWGQVDTTHKTDVLRTAELNVVPCYNASDKAVICTDSSKGIGTCSGDSGGPLVIPGQDKDGDVVVGITLGGSCGTESPGYDIITRVGYYLDWIKESSDAVVSN